MEYSDLMIFIMEMLGTVAFASSGAMLGIERKMDIFGVNVLGVTTAVGGGIIRDLILGINPPVTFLHAVYALAAVITSTLLFLAVYIRNQVFSGNIARWYDRIMLLCDTIGLGYQDNHFLVVFVGVITGVGGGVIRDMMAGTMPYIFVKHVYAVASIAGGIVFIVLYPYTGRIVGMMTGAGVVCSIRFLAAYYRWNLPRIH